MMDMCSQRLKTNPNVRNVKHKMYKDNTIHSYYYSEVEDIFLYNVEDYGM
jgi:hypothetical protein